MLVRRSDPRDAALFASARRATMAMDTAPAVRNPLAERREVSMADMASLAPEPKVGALSFANFPFQAPHPESTAGPGLPGLYSQEVAEAESVVIMKSTQLGVSAWAWRWAIREVDQNDSTVLYIFPTDRHVTEFGRERIDPSMQASAYFRGRIPRGFINNAHQKRIGGGFLYLRGSTRTRVDQRAAAAQSVAGDAIVFDEYDDLEPATVAQYERRLSGARQAGRTARIRRIGVPTVDGFGISAAFARSDRRRWYVHCEACDAENPVEWEAVRWTTEASAGEVCRPGHDVYLNDDDVLDAWRVCTECEERIDVGNGRWIAENPDSPRIGFHASRLIVPLVDLRSIVAASRGTAPHQVETFHQNDLGIPYTSTETGLTKEDVLAIAQATGEEMPDAYRGPDLITMGVDTAGSRALNVRISRNVEDGRALPLWVGEASFDDLDDLMERYGVTLCLIDSMPERQNARAFQARWGVRRVLLFRYDFKVDADAIRVDEHKGMAAAHRADTLSAMLTQVRDGRRVLPKRPPPRYAEQMAALRRKLVPDSRDRMHYEYVTTGSAGDDAAHAEAYDLVALDILLAWQEADIGTAEVTVAGGVEHVPLDFDSDGL